MWTDYQNSLDDGVENKLEDVVGDVLEDDL